MLIIADIVLIVWNCLQVNATEDVDDNPTSNLIPHSISTSIPIQMNKCIGCVLVFKKK